jgi:hypothetical protein
VIVPPEPLERQFCRGALSTKSICVGVGGGSKSGSKAASTNAPLPPPKHKRIDEKDAKSHESLADVDDDDNDDDDDVRDKVDSTSKRDRSKTTRLEEKRRQDPVDDHKLLMLLPLQSNHKSREIGTRKETTPPYSGTSDSSDEEEEEEEVGTGTGMEGSRQDWLSVTSDDHKKSTVVATQRTTKGITTAGSVTADFCADCRRASELERQQRTR